jgi:hypothetical protein
MRTGTGTRLLADRNLGSNRQNARAKGRRLLARWRNMHPYAWLQFSQHAPEGYAGAYSAQLFTNDARLEG